MQRVVIDANVFVSLLTGRHEKQHEAARALLQEAEEGNLVAIAVTNRYDAVATFDRKLSNRREAVGLAAYW